MFEFALCISIGVLRSVHSGADMLAKFRQNSGEGSIKLGKNYGMSQVYVNCI